jgi:hypothetical protein
MKPQDVVVALGLAAAPDDKVTYPALAASLGLSASETHAAVARLMEAGLVNPERKAIRQNLLEFLLHGLKYAFPAKLSGPTLGVPTGASAPFTTHLSPPEPGPWVWPSADGTRRGLGIEPLHPRVPAAALRNEKLYEMLTLVDLLRAGRTREKNYATKRLQELLS